MRNKTGTPMTTHRVRHKHRWGPWTTYEAALGTPYRIATCLDCRRQKTQRRDKDGRWR